MKITTIETTGTNETNGTVYDGYLIKYGKIVYSVVVAHGKLNYVSVAKKSQNPFGSVGKDFADFNAAISNYKNASLKIGLVKIQNGIF